MNLTAALTKTTVRLSHEMGRGGEGVVYSIEGRADQVAKLYHELPTTGKAQKLVYMAGLTTPALLKVSAWPIDVLVTAKGEPRGFVMQRLSTGRDIHELYSPKSRFDAFPEADFRFIVHVAANVARAFATIHAQGLVAGDVNHGNLAVGADGTVKFIDCDSFQVGNGATVFTCDVGVLLFTPPELQNKSFRGLIRTVDHDRFGLAVLLFHLLFMGRHPFAGRFTGRGEMPIERAIAEHRFAYGPDNTRSEMQRSPGTLPLEAIGSSIANLFIRAFGKASSNGGRPTGETWAGALDQLKANLKICPSATWHYYPGHLNACPWCIVEAKTGVRLFGSKVVLTTGGLVDISSLWTAITTITAPAPDPPLPSEQPWSPPPGGKCSRKQA